MPLQLKLILCVLCCSLSSFAQINQSQINDLANTFGKASFDQFIELLSIPNDAFMKEEIEKNVQWAEKTFQSKNFTTKRLETASAPLLLAERSSEGAQKTLLIYLQFDGQPVDPSKWEQESPWKPVLKEKDEAGNWKEIPLDNLKKSFNPEWRIFARSASDAKGPIVEFLAALDAVASINTKPNYHLKVIMDFEEEQGSPQLPAAVEKYKSDLSADALIIFDGPRHISNEPTLTFGARGISTITLTVYGPRAPQHSGHYGNYAPNPAMRLMQLIASMKDEEGRVTIPTFYDGIVISDAARKAMEAVPDDEAMIKKNLGIAKTDGVAESYQEAIQYPSLNVRGLSSGWVGRRVRTIVPATATAEIDIRTVMENDPERLIHLVKSHIQAQGYYLVDREPTEEERMKYDRIAFFRASTSYGAYRTPIDSEVGLWLDSALTRAFGKEPIKIRTSGGSIPISPFVISLNVPAVTVPTVNRDNNQHSPNENIRLGNYIDGIRTFIAILTEDF